MYIYSSRHANPKIYVICVFFVYYVMEVTVMLLLHMEDIYCLYHLQLLNHLVVYQYIYIEYPVSYNKANSI